MRRGGGLAAASALALGAALAACSSAPVPGPGAAAPSAEAAPPSPGAAARTPARAGLPAVHLIATGGTISNQDEGGRLTGSQIAERIPGLDDVATLSVEQFSNIASGSMTPELWLGLARRVRNAFDSIPGLAGVVITHGTDTIEETAYFLDLVIDDEGPVVLTGAMRNASRLSDDGPANLYNAVRLAVSPEARGRGAMLVMNDRAFPARDVTKRNTIRVEAFDAGARGPVAILDPDSIVFMEPKGRHLPAMIDVGAFETLPRVDVLYVYAGADGALVDAAVAAGARGLVLAAVGRGGLTPGQYDAVARAVEEGVHVVTSSRTMSGRVPVGDPDRRLDLEPGEGLRLGAGDLTPQKARILLMLGLASTDRPAELLRIFQTH